MINKNKMIVDDYFGGENFGIATVLGSWADHYKSWTNTKIAPLLIIKYEPTFISILHNQITRLIYY